MRSLSLRRVFFTKSTLTGGFFFSLTKNPRSSERGFFIQADRLGISPTPLGVVYHCRTKFGVYHHTHRVCIEICRLDDMPPLADDIQNFVLTIYNGLRR